MMKITKFLSVIVPMDQCISYRFLLIRNRIRAATNNYFDNLEMLVSFIGQITNRNN